MSNTITSWALANGGAIVVSHAMLTLFGCVLLAIPGTLQSKLNTARLLAFLLLAAPFLLLAAPRMPNSSVQARSQGALVEATLKTKIDVKQNAPMVAEPSPAWSIDWKRTLIALWAFGATIASVCFAVSILKTHSHFCRLVDFTPEDAERLRSFLPSSSAIKRLRICLDPQAKSPYSLRWRVPILVLPKEAFTSMDHRSLAIVARHEWAHLRHWDSLDPILWRLLGVVYWWNPILPLMDKTVAVWQEWRADREATQEDRAEGIRLARLLVNHVASAFPLSLPQGISSSSPRELKRRITRLLEPPQPPRHARCLAFARGLVLVGGASSLVACAQWLPSRSIQSGLYADEGVKELLKHSHVLMGTTIEELKASEREELRAVESRLEKVKNTVADNRSVIDLEFQIFETERDGRGLEAPVTQVLTSTDAAALIKKLGTQREMTCVSNSRVRALNKRAVSIRSGPNYPIITAIDDQTNTTYIELLRAGMIMNIAPAILESGQIHCECELTINDIIREEIREGRRYPVVATRVYSGPSIFPPDHTLLLEGLNESVTSGTLPNRRKRLLVLMSASIVK